MQPRKQKLSVKVIDAKDQTHEEMERIKKIMIGKAKAYYDAKPFITRIYMAMNTKFPLSFLQANWKEITGGEE